MSKKIENNIFAHLSCNMKRADLYNIYELKKEFKDWFFFLQKKQNFKIKGVYIDSREVEKCSLFVAIVGDKNDGHDYINQAIKNGANCIICEKIPDNIDISRYKNVVFITVKNSVTALQDLARYNRSRLKAKVIGITGNIGKTTTRELIKIAVGIKYKTVSSKKNYNNHIGLPIVIANTSLDTECLVLEMGMNHVGEIDFLTKIARPDIAIITKISTAHIGNFNSINDIVRAKAEIFNNMGNGKCVILDNSSLFFNDLLSFAKKNNITNVITVGKEKADVCLKQCCVCNDFKIKYKILIKNHEYTCKINSIAKHNAFNSLFAFAVADMLNIDIKSVIDKFSDFQPLKGRGNFENKQMNDGKNITVINDCYNSSPEALKESIKNLHEVSLLRPKSRIVAVIGDMLELGEMSMQFHLEIAEVINANNIHNVVCVGQESRFIYDNLKQDINKKYFKNTIDCAKEILSFIKDNDILLLKASLGMHFNSLIEVLNKNSNVTQ